MIPAAGWYADAARGHASSARTTDYTMLSSPTCRRQPEPAVGALYAFDETNHRIVAFDKANGKYVEQYQLAATTTLGRPPRPRVLPAPDADAPATLWWISSTGLHSALLEAGRGAADGVAHAAPDQGGPAPTPEADEDSPGRDAPAHDQPCSRSATRTRRGGRPSSRSSLIVAVLVAFAASCASCARAATRRSTRSSTGYGVVPADLTAPCRPASSSRCPCSAS